MRRKRMLAIAAAVSLIPGVAGLASACGGKADVNQTQPEEEQKQHALAAANEMTDFLHDAGVISDDMTQYMKKIVLTIEQGEDLNGVDIFSALEYCEVRTLACQNEGAKKTALDYIFDAKLAAYQAVLTQGTRLLSESSNCLKIEAKTSLTHKVSGNVDFVDYNFPTSQDPAKIGLETGVVGEIDLAGQKTYALASSEGTAQIVGSASDRLDGKVEGVSFTSQVGNFVSAALEDAKQVNYDGEHFTLVSETEDGKSTKVSYTLDEQGALTGLEKESNSENEQSKSMISYSTATEDEYTTYYTAISQTVQEITGQNQTDTEQE